MIKGEAFQRKNTVQACKHLDGLNLDTVVCFNRTMIPNINQNSFLKWIKKTNIKLLEWHSQNPDLKRIERFLHYA